MFAVERLTLEIRVKENNFFFSDVELPTYREGSSCLTWWSKLSIASIASIASLSLSYEKLLDVKKPCKYIYTWLATSSARKLKLLDKYRLKFSENSNFVYSEKEYLGLFRDLYRITNITKFRDFQYRLLLNKIYTNDVLSKWGVVTQDKCEFCEKNNQTLSHVFWECEVVQGIWAYITETMNIASLSINSVLSNQITAKPHQIENFIILIVKQHIYSCKCSNIKPTVLNTKSKILYWKNIEQYNAEMSVVSKKYQARWSNTILL